MLEKQIWVKKLNYLTQFLDNNELDNRSWTCLSSNWVVLERTLSESSIFSFCIWKSSTIFLLLFTNNELHYIQVKRKSQNKNKSHLRHNPGLKWQVLGLSSVLSKVSFSSFLAAFQLKVFFVTISLLLFSKKAFELYIILLINFQSFFVSPGE